MHSIDFFRVSSSAFRVRYLLLEDCRCELLAGLRGKDSTIIIIDNLISSGVSFMRTASACQAIATHALLIEKLPVVLAHDARQKFIATKTVASPELLES